jgi:hypothetical protein
VRRQIAAREKSGSSNRLRRCAAILPCSGPPKSLLRRNKTATKLSALVIFAWLIVLANRPADAYLAYVSNEKGNSVSVLDTDTMTSAAIVWRSLTHAKSRYFGCSPPENAFLKSPGPSRYRARRSANTSSIIRRKLGLRTAAEMVRFAIEEKLG